MKNKIFLLALIVILLINSVNAFKFSELGFDSLIVEGVNTRDCAEWFFSLHDIGQSQKLVLLLRAKFLPIASKNAEIIVNFNSREQHSLYIENFDCNAEICRAYLILDKNNLHENNKLVVCAKTTNTTQRIELMNDSQILTIPLAEFKQENFRKEVDKGLIFQGDLVKVTISITNSGTAPAKIFLRRASQKLTKMNKPFKIVSGKSEWTLVVNPKETKKVYYALLPLAAVSYTLPPAILEWTDSLNFKHILKSSQPSFEVIPKRSIEAFLLLERNSYAPCEEFPIKVIIKNNTSFPIYNLKILIDESSKLLPLIEAEKTTNIFLSEKICEEGQHNISLKIYKDKTLLAKQSAKIYIREPLPIAFIVLALLVVFLIGFALYTIYKK